MGIIPKEGEKKESIGIIPLIVVHHIMGFGILMVGQRTKNVFEFWGGLAVFLIAVFYLFMGFSILGTPENFSESLMGILYTLYSLVTWLYLLVRLIWIFVKKETKISII
jgi:hypothetical protein